MSTTIKQIGLGAIVATGCLIFSGCAMSDSDVATGDTSFSSNQYQQMSQPTSIKMNLADAATKVSHSLQELSAINKSAYPENATLPYENVAVGVALKQPLAMQWYGPIQPALQRVANKVGYKFQVYGKQPKTPVLVDIDTIAQAQPAVEIIRNMDLQAGLNASVLLFPDQKIISLRYV